MLEAPENMWYLYLQSEEEIQLGSAGPLTDENENKTFILLGVYKFSGFPTAKKLTNNSAGTLFKFMQMHIVNQRIPRFVRCDEARFNSRFTSPQPFHHYNPM